MPAVVDQVTFWTSILFEKTDIKTLKAHADFQESVLHTLSIDYLAGGYVDISLFFMKILLKQKYWHEI